jgi:hypothetical protein
MQIALALLAFIVAAVIGGGVAYAYRQRPGERGRS